MCVFVRPTLQASGLHSAVRVASPCPVVVAEVAGLGIMYVSVRAPEWATGKPSFALSVRIWEGKERKGKEREGKERKGKERKGRKEGRKG